MTLFGLDLTSSLKRITNVHANRAFLVVFQFSFSRRNSDGGEMRIKSSCVAQAPSVSGQFSITELDVTSIEAGKCRSLSEQSWRWLCPQPASGESTHLPMLAFPTCPSAPCNQTSACTISSKLPWTSGIILGSPPSLTAQGQENFNCHKCGRTFRRAWNQLCRLWNNCCVTPSNHAVKGPWRWGGDLHPPTRQHLVSSRCRMGTPQPALPALHHQAAPGAGGPP